MGRSVAQQIQVRTRQARALELRLEGHTYASIAADVGYAGPSAAWKAVQRAVLEIGQDEAHLLAALQIERLDGLLSGVWPIATDEKHPRWLQSVETALKIMDRMNRIRGLA